MEKNLEDNYTFIYCLIQDGWENADESVKEKLKQIFPHEQHWKEIETWKESDYRNQVSIPPQKQEIDDNNNTQPSLQTLNVNETQTPKKDKVTYIFQTKIDQDTNVCGLTEIPDTEEKILLSLIIKKDNRKKHNSHQWFFSSFGFCGAIQPDLCFATDCSTLFDEPCLTLLITKMLENADCAVCTGRQVVMDSSQQGSRDSLLEMLYRAAQRYDFESSFSVFVGAFALFGFLPVVPGPCGLYRWNFMVGKPLDWYFDTVNTPTAESGIILSNLKIAEDRILSYSAVLKTREETIMCVVPNAEFYFEAETDLAQLAKQRRRWINGTFAGYLYLISHPRLLFFESKMNILRKLGVFLLIWFQVFTCLVTQLTPSIFLCAWHSVLFWIFPVTTSEPFAYATISAIFLAYLVLYVAFVLRHSQPGDDKTFIGWMFYVLLVFSMLVVLLSFGSSLARVIKGHWINDGVLDETKIIIVSAYSIMVIPVLISFFVHIRSSLRLITSIVPFYLFLPTLVAWFSSYSAARFWDVSWGNRPGSSQSSEDSLNNEQAKKLKEKEEKKNLETKKKMQSQALTYTVILILSNLAIVLLYVFEITSRTFVFSMAVAVAAFQVVFGVISFIFFFFNHLIGDVILIGGLAFLLKKLISRLPRSNIHSQVLQPMNKEKSDDMEPFLPNPRREATKADIFRLGIFQGIINVCYQITFLSITKDLNDYDSNLFKNYGIQSIGFPLMGVLYIIVAWIGDRRGEKNYVMYKAIMVVGVVFLVISTAVFEILLMLKTFNSQTNYWLLLTQAYTQVAALNIIGASTFALFLLYVKNTDLLKFIIARNILGAIGNLLPAVINVVIYYVIYLPHKDNFVIASTIRSVIICLLNILGVLIMWKSIKGAPQQTEQVSHQTATPERFAAIVLITYFMFTFALSPFQFQLKTYFDEVKPKESILFTSLDFVIQEFISVIIGTISMLTKLRDHLKAISVFLGLSSLIQFVFLHPKLATSMLDLQLSLC